MKKISETAFAVWVVVLFATVLLVLTAPFVDWPGWKEPFWSGWIQTVGAIAAIFGSAWGVRHQIAAQRAHDIEMAAHAELEAQARACMRLEVLTRALLDALNRIRPALENIAVARDYLPVGYVDPAGLRAFERQFEAFGFNDLPQNAVHVPVMVSSNLIILVGAINEIRAMCSPITDQQLSGPLGSIKSALNIFGHARVVADQERKRLNRLLGREDTEPFFLPTGATGLGAAAKPAAHE